MKYGLNGLKEKELKLILFSGKGGVGKTTCAASTGLYLSKFYKTLIISTDPAHSLADSLEVELEDKIEKVNGIKNLYAVEINAENLLSQFKIEYEDDLKSILSNSTYLDQDDIDSIITLPIPGIDEVMGFKTIIDLIEEAEFDKYIVDTAPTGHALRLLTLPALFDEWIAVIAKMRWKYRYMIERFAGQYTPDEGDDFLMKMKRTVKKIEKLLTDSDKCEFIPVTIPEYMAVIETERMLANLNENEIKVRQMVINNVFEVRDCSFCSERRVQQQKYINRIKKNDHIDMTVAYSQPREVRGIESLSNFKEMLFRE
ncbi:MAG: ArsA family ATPase [Ignavibacteria bacterium]|jgi:arsenite-transporting ATPase